MSAVELEVVRTSRSDQEIDHRDYLVQLSGELLDSEFPDIEDGDVLLVRSPNGSIETALHARVYRRDDLDLGTEQVGIDFSLRYALGVAARHDLSLDEDDAPEERDPGRETEGITGDSVIVEKRPRPSKGYRYWVYDRLLRVRPEICRVRMAVHPDLENQVCRITGNTMELIGIEEGDNVAIESPYGVVTGVKAFRIDRESLKRKRRQRRQDEERYTDCYSEMKLERIRDTNVDIPDIYLDAEVRRSLSLGRGFGGGVCQPVRVYRDTSKVFRRRALDTVVPFSFALVSATLGIFNLVNPTFFGFSELTAVVFFLALVLLVVTVVRVVQIRDFLR